MMMHIYIYQCHNWKITCKNAETLWNHSISSPCLVTCDDEHMPLNSIANNEFCNILKSWSLLCFMTHDPLPWKRTFNHFICSLLLSWLFFLFFPLFCEGVGCPLSKVKKAIQFLATCILEMPISIFNCAPLIKYPT